MRFKITEYPELWTAHIVLEVHGDIYIGESDGLGELEGTCNEIADELGLNAEFVRVVDESYTEYLAALEVSP